MAAFRNKQATNLFYAFRIGVITLDGKISSAEEGVRNEEQMELNTITEVEKGPVIGH